MQTGGRPAPQDGLQRTPEPGPGERPSRGSELGPYAVAGLQFGGVLLAFTMLGYWLDTRLHTLPLLTLLGAAVGGVGGFLHLYRSLTAPPSDGDRVA